MSVAPLVDRAVASRLVAALEHAWTTIRRHHPEVPQVVIVVASGSDPRSRRLNLGHFAAGRWQLTSSDQPSDRAEVLVSGEGLQRGPVDVLGTLLHEAAHGLSYARKISDTSRQGRYHNRRYARPLRQHAGRAGSRTRAVAPGRACQRGRAGPGRSRNALACSCGCGRRIRVARSVLELAPILCAGCGQPFEPEDDAAR
jgi:hypothetical protein